MKRVLWKMTPIVFCIFRKIRLISSNKTLRLVAGKLRVPKSSIFFFLFKNAMVISTEKNGSGPIKSRISILKKMKSKYAVFEPRHFYRLWDAFFVNFCFFIIKTPVSAYIRLVRLGKYRFRPEFQHCVLTVLVCRQRVTWRRNRQNVRTVPSKT